MKRMMFLLICMGLVLVGCGGGGSHVTINIKTDDGGEIAGAVVKLENVDKNLLHTYEKIASKNSVALSGVALGDYVLSMSHDNYKLYTNTISINSKKFLYEVSAVRVYNIGDIGPAGGIVFYDKGVFGVLGMGDSGEF